MTPVPQGIVHRVLQRSPAGRDRNDIRSQQFHPEHVGRLALHIVHAHVYDAFQSEPGANRGRCDAVLPGAGLGDYPGFPHSAGQKDLAEHVVDLVSSGMVQLVPFHVHFRAAEMLGKPLGKVKRRRTAHIVLPKIVHFGPEAGLRFRFDVFGFQIQDQGHQRFRHESPAEFAEATPVRQAPS